MRKIRLTESELTNVIRKIIQEQSSVTKPISRFDDFNAAYQQIKNNPYSGHSRGRGVVQSKGFKKIESKMSGGLFANGVDTIDTNSTEFKQGVNAIRDAIKNESEITIEGGASKVGFKRGYNNEALAQRRANNFITAVKNMYPDLANLKYNITYKVGESQELNSDAAKAEQYVKVIYYKKGYEDFNITQAVDNTQHYWRLGYNPNDANVKKRDDGQKDDDRQRDDRKSRQKFVRVTADIPASTMELFQKFIDQNQGKVINPPFIMPRPGQMPGWKL